MASGSKIVETGIYAVGALIIIYYGVTHQEQLKMWYNKFVMSAQSQLSGGDNMGGMMPTTAAQMPAMGDNTSGSDNTPAVTTTPTPTATPTPDNTSMGPMFTGQMPSGPDVNALGGPQALNQIASGQAPAQPQTIGGVPTGVPINVQVQMPTRQQPIQQVPVTSPTQITPQQKVIGDSQSLQQGIDRLRRMRMPQMPMNQAIPQSILNTVLPVTPPPPSPTATTTGRPMKQIQKVMAPRRSNNNLANEKRQAVAAGNVITTPDQANQMCVCSTQGRWRGPGCNVGNKFCGMIGQRGTKR